MTESSLESDLKLKILQNIACDISNETAQFTEHTNKVDLAEL